MQVFFISILIHVLSHENALTVKVILLCSIRSNKMLHYIISFSDTNKYKCQEKI